MKARSVLYIILLVLLVPSARAIANSAPQWVIGTYWLSQDTDGGVTLCYVEDITSYGRSYLIPCKVWDDPKDPGMMRTLVYHVGVFDLSVKAIEEDGELEDWDLHFLQFPIHEGRVWNHTVTRTGDDGGLYTTTSAYRVVGTEKVNYNKGEDAYIINATGDYIADRVFHYVPSIDGFPGSCIADIVNEWSTGRLTRLISHGKTPIPLEDVDVDGIPEIAAPLLEIEEEPHEGMRLIGRFVNAATGDPVRGMSIFFPGDDRKWTSDVLGKFLIPLPDTLGTMLISFSHPEFCFERGIIRVNKGEERLLVTAEPEEGCDPTTITVEGEEGDLGDIPVWPHASYRVISDIEIGVSFTVQSECTGRFQKGTGMQSPAKEHIITTHGQTDHKIKLELRPPDTEVEDTIFVIPHQAACNTVLVRYLGDELHLSLCGNDNCEPGEDADLCPQDCIGAECGNGLCEHGESASACPADCEASVTIDLPRGPNIAVGEDIEVAARYGTGSGQLLEGTCICWLREVTPEPVGEPFDGHFEMDLDKEDGTYRISLETGEAGVYRVWVTCSLEDDNATSPEREVRVSRSTGSQSLRVTSPRASYELGETVSLRIRTEGTGNSCNYRLVIERPSGEEWVVGTTGAVASCREHGWGFSTDSAFTEGAGMYTVRVQELSQGIEGFLELDHGSTGTDPTSCADDDPGSATSKLVLVRGHGTMTVRMGGGTPTSAHGYLSLRDAVIDEPVPRGMEGDLDDGCMYGCPCTNDELVTVDDTTVRFRLGVCDDEDIVDIAYRITGPNPAVKVSLKEGDGVLVGFTGSYGGETAWLPLCTGASPLEISVDRNTAEVGEDVIVDVVTRYEGALSVKVTRPDGTFKDVSMRQVRKTCQDSPCQCPTGEQCSCPQTCTFTWRGSITIDLDGPKGLYRIECTLDIPDASVEKDQVSFTVADTSAVDVHVELDRYIITPGERVEARVYINENERPVQDAVVVGTIMVEVEVDDGPLGVEQTPSRQRPLGGKVYFRNRADHFVASFTPPGPDEYELHVLATLDSGSHAEGNVAFSVKERVESAQSIEREALDAARADEFGRCAERYMEAARYWLARQKSDEGIHDAVRAATCLELDDLDVVQRSAGYKEFAQLLRRSPFSKDEVRQHGNAAVLSLVAIFERLSGDHFNAAATLEEARSILDDIIGKTCPSDDPLCAAVDPLVLDTLATIQRITGDIDGFRKTSAATARILESKLILSCVDEVRAEHCSPVITRIGSDEHNNLVFTVENPGPNTFISKSALYRLNSGNLKQCGLPELTLGPGRSTRVVAECEYDGSDRVSLKVTCLRSRSTCASEDYVFGLLALSRKWLQAGERLQSTSLKQQVVDIVLNEMKGTDYPQQLPILTFIAARTLASIGDQKGAKDACTNANSLLGRIADTSSDSLFFSYGGMSQCHRILGSEEKADDLLEKAERSLSALDTVNAHRFRSGLLFAQGEHDRARVECRRALVEGLDEPELHRDLIFTSFCLDILQRSEVAANTCSLLTIVPDNEAQSMLSVFSTFPPPLSYCHSATLLSPEDVSCGDGQCDLGETSRSCCVDCPCSPGMWCSRTVGRCVPHTSLEQDESRELAQELIELARFARELEALAGKLENHYKEIDDTDRAMKARTVRPLLAGIAKDLVNAAKELPNGPIERASGEADALRGVLRIARASVARAMSTWEGDNGSP